MEADDVISPKEEAEMREKMMAKLKKERDEKNLEEIKAHCLAHGYSLDQSPMYHFMQAQKAKDELEKQFRDAAIINVAMRDAEDGMFSSKGFGNLIEEEVNRLRKLYNEEITLDDKKG